MNLSRPIMRLVLAIAAVAGWFALLSPASYFAAPVSQSIDPAGIASSVGFAYTAPVTLRPSHPAFFAIATNTIFGPKVSNLSLLENGTALGPAHSFHSEVWKPGGGHYSHWGDSTSSAVVFSTSDNSDPRTNGRLYVISAQPEFTPLLVSLLLIVALTASLLLATTVSLPWRGATLAVAAAGLMAWTWLYFGRTLLSDDTSTYVTWQAIVPLGYPLWLSAIKSVTGSLRWTALIQVSLLVSACLFLALQVSQLMGRTAAGFATLLVLLIYTPMFSTEQYILSEGLFLPLAIINLGAAMALIRQVDVKYAILLSLTAVLIMLVRPAGYYAILGPVFLLIAARSRLWWLRWAIVPMVLFVLASMLLNFAIRGSTSQSQVGRILFPHVAFLFDPKLVTGADQEYATLVHEALERYRAEYQKSTTRSARFNFLLSNFNQRLLATDAAIGARLRSESSGPGSDEDRRRYLFRRINDIYMSLFLSAVLNHPTEYLRLVAEQLLGAWQYSIMFDYGRFTQIYALTAVTDYQTHVNMIRDRKLPLGPEDVRPNTDLLEKFPGRFIDALDTAYRNIRSQRWLVYLIGLVTLIAIPIGGLFRRQSRHWLALGYCGIMIHGSVLLIAAVTVFIPRYALPADPIILVAGVIMMDGVLAWVRTGPMRSISDVFVPARRIFQRRGQH
ncbi:MAG: Pectate lyase [Bradyrhizobium sp.]|nr:Pectate lyase [Bradyrhizobium sp.]